MLAPERPLFTSPSLACNRYVARRLDISQAMKKNTQVIFVRNADARLSSLLVEPTVPGRQHKGIVDRLRALGIYVERLDTLTTADRRFTGLKVCDHSGVPWSRAREHELADSVVAGACADTELQSTLTLAEASPYAALFGDGRPRLCA